MKFNLIGRLGSKHNKKHFGKKLAIKKKPLAILKLFVFLTGLALFIVPVILNEKLIWVSLLGFAIMAIILSKKITSKEEMKVIRTSVKNILFSIFYLLIGLITIILLLGLSFSFKDLEMIKLLLILSFTLAAITFVKSEKPKTNSKEDVLIHNSLVLSSFYFILSGLLLLSEISIGVLEPISPFSGEPIYFYDFFIGLKGTFAVFGSFIFCFGVLLLGMAMINKVKKLSTSKQDSFREWLSKFFGLTHIKGREKRK